MDRTIFKKNTENIITWLRTEYSHTHTGRAAPDFFDSVSIDAYGVSQLLKNISSISIEDAKTLRIDIWDIGLIPAIEKKIKEMNLSISTIVDGKGMRAIFPQLTQETRLKMIKLIKDKHEEARVKVRQEREKIMNTLKNDNSGEDMIKSKKEQVQKDVDEVNKKLDNLLSIKTEELSKIS